MGILLYLHPSGGHEVASARGGWMLDELLEKKTGALCCYLTCLEINVTRGYHILGKHTNIRRTAKEPNLVFLNSGSQEFTTNIDNFLFRILHLSKRSPIFQTHLKHMVRTCFASVLVWIDQV